MVEGRPLDREDRFLLKARWGALPLGVLLGLFNADALRTAFERSSWTEVPCKVVKAEMKPAVRGSAATTTFYYQMFVVAEYRHEGAEFKAESVDRPLYKSGSVGPAEHRLPDPFTCRVNPARPDEFSWDAGTASLAQTALFPSFFVFAGGLVFFMMTPRRKRKSRERRFPKRS